MRRRTLALACIGAICAGGIATWRLEAKEPSPAPYPPAPPVPVVTTTVAVSDFPVVKFGLGTVSVYNTVDVHAQVTGTIQKIGFVEGQPVEPGSLIAQLDPRPFQAALQQAEASLQRDEAHLANAQANLNRFLPLLKNGFATQQQAEDQTAVVAEQRAAIASDQAAIANAQAQVSYTTITSPISGVTGIRRVDIGNIVQPTNTTPIVTITQLQPISVIFALPQKDLPAVQAAMAKGTLQTRAYTEGGSKPVGTGTLLLVNNMVSQSSGAVALKATFPNADKALWPGKFVDIRLVVGVRRDGLSVPLSALQQGQNGTQVFVVGADGRVQIRAVASGETLDGRALIDSGLKPGEAVVVAGQYRLDQGVRIASVAPGNPRVQNITPATQGLLQ